MSSPTWPQSFRHADLLLYRWESDGQPCYVAVEVSFTVNAHDVRRAARNADYLQKYTGIPAHAVVAGVDVLQEAQARIELGEAPARHQREGMESEQLFGLNPLTFIFDIINDIHEYRSW